MSATGNAAAPERVGALLQKARFELLDLSNRNKLLNTPRRSRYTTSLEIVDEISSEVFRILVRDGRSLSFNPGKTKAAEGPEASGDDPEEATLPQPEDDDVDDRGIASRHADTKLQTLLTSEGLQRRLLSLFYDARTFLEEQGVNILYLAAGMLRWYEASTSDVERFAPLVLIPVSLERRSATERFFIRWTGEDPLPNLTLAAKLKADFGLIMPEFGDFDDFVISEYLAACGNIVAGQPRWAVHHDDMVVGFFSFAKFLMYRDLDPGTWPPGKPLDEQPAIRALLRDGFPETDPLLDGEQAEQAVRRLATECFVLDADSSQSLAIEEVRRGQHLVIQGPPGTGKSQTIANIIADAVQRNQSVLFVAEKMAALEVVKRRLEVMQLDALCLELHSHKANKRSVLEELKRTLNLGQPIPPADTALMPALDRVRTELDSHSARIGSRGTATGQPIFDSLGHLVTFQAEGLASLDLQLADAVSWDATAIAERLALLRDLADRFERDGSPAASPWRGVERNAVLPTELDGIMSLVTTAGERLEHYRKCLESLCALLYQPVPDTIEAASGVVSLGSAIVDAPPLDRATIAEPVWNDRNPLVALVSAGASWASNSGELTRSVGQAAWTIDLLPIRRTIARHGSSWLRWFSGDYRKAKRQLRELFKGELPPEPEQLALLDRLMAARAARDEVERAESLGRMAFGVHWRGTESNFDHLQRILTWVETHDAAPVRALAARIENPASVAEALQAVADTAENLRQTLLQLTKTLALDVQSAFGVATLEHVRLNELSERIALWRGSREHLSRWIIINALRRKAERNGLKPLVERLWSGELAPQAALPVFRSTYHGSLVKEAFQQHPELGLFDGDQHDRALESYRNMDAATHYVARFKAALAHWKSIPRSSGAVGPLGVLKTEMEKRRRHLPLRQLMKHAGGAVQAIKPVFMMSPLSIAQFLEPGAVEFDLVLFDEASQVQPVDALGAIARGRQIVVVGDDKQLPPTRFFARLSSDSEDDDEEIGEGARDIESILGLCRARGVPQTMLRWHYRSRHQSLIAVSNREFYENSLFIVPSPWTDAATMGLRFRFIRQGVFDTGGSATNRIEAKAVAEAIIRHARMEPNLSLGVGTFSVKQRQAILDELELLRRQNPTIEEFFVNHAAEPFFVKNLENIQGDERDVIFISVGYGKNSSGYMAMRFGPLSAEGGERRLNVLISRAKMRCEVFASITADDIDLERGRGRGVAALKAFLSFAEKGVLDTGHETGRDHDSPFEEEVARALRAQGYEVRRQVGLAGFFIDLAVVDPRRPGKYILGIECDGASYHGMRSVRDRDRLRQAVLEDHGWRIHRIWSLDWFQRPKEQLQRTVQAIEAAMADSAVEDADRTRRAVPINFATFEREDERAVDGILSSPYMEAAFQVPAAQQIHELTSGHMADIVTKIVQVEGPIHEDEITIRVRQLWGLSRAGSRIQNAARAGIDAAMAAGHIARDAGFCSVPSGAVTIRDRSAVNSASLRKPAMLPPAEVAAAILAIIDAHKGASTPELGVHVPRVLGFAATSAALRALVESQIEALHQARQIDLMGGIWSRCSS